ncbi:MAG: hypothetical protein JXA49_02400 [Actinobacteria bacterium]|nr:hypothetical protein [Actinomycetota bacterium]
MDIKKSPAGRKGTTAIVVALVLVLTGLAVLQYSLDNSGAATSGWDDTTPVDTARSIVDILGGVREALAAYFWTKTDTLHHDYLGGDIHNEQVLYPYYWMITRLDPHFTMAYYFASWMLCRFGLVDEGFNLALEGLRYNPYSEQMQSNLAYLYFFFKQDPEKARYHLLKAMELTDDEEQIEVYGTFLRTIDRVLSGELDILETKPLEKDSDILNEVEREHHEHEH